MSEKIINVLFLCTGNTARSVLAEGILRNLQDARREMHSLGQSQQGLRLATGRTLARTWVADWLVRISAQVQPEWTQIRTGSLAETLAWLAEQLETLEVVPADLAALATAPERAQRLLETACELELAPGLAIQWFAVRLEPPG